MCCLLFVQAIVLEAQKTPATAGSGTPLALSSTALALHDDSVPSKIFMLNTHAANDLVNRQQKIFSERLASCTTVFSGVKKLVNEPLRLNHATVNYTGLVDNSTKQGGAGVYTNDRSGNFYYGDYSLASDWTVTGIPVSIGLARQSWTGVNDNSGRVTLEFNRDEYMNNLKKKLAGKYDPASLLPSPADLTRDLVAEAKNALQTELKNLNDKYKGLLDNELSVISRLQDITAVDLKSLRNRFLNPEFISQVAEKENLLATLQQKLNSGEAVNRAEMQRLQQEVIKLKAVQELIGKVGGHQAKWESSGLLKKIKESNLLHNDKIARLVNDPSTTRKMAKQLLSLKGLERLFLNINRLDIGQSALTLSPGSFSHFLNNGMITEFLNKGRSMLVMAGRQKDINSVLDMPFAASLFSSNGIAKAARVEVGRPGASSTHIAVSSFDQSLMNIAAPFNSASLRKVLVTTVSHQLTVGEKGFIYVDLSRSATQYRNALPPSDSTLGDKSPLSNMLSGENLLASTAVSIKYAGEVSKSGLSCQLSFDKAGNGYSNPGNGFMSGGTTALGLNLRKSFLQNRIMVSLRASGREYNYDVNEDRKWRSAYTTLDARWKMSKGQYMALRYQPTKMVRLEPGSKELVTSVERFSFDLNLYKRVQGTIYRNLVTLGWQQSEYRFTGNNAKNTSLLLNSFQNISIGKNLLFINTSYNKAVNQGFVYLNSSFMNEAGYAYQLFGKLSASSGLVYNSVTGWYRQAGVRQTLNGQLGERLSVNIYVDARKNLAVYQPLWNEPVRADIALRYVFGNKE